MPRPAPPRFNVRHPRPLLCVPIYLGALRRVVRSVTAAVAERAAVQAGVSRRPTMRVSLPVTPFNLGDPLLTICLSMSLVANESAEGPLERLRTPLFKDREGKSPQQSCGADCWYSHEVVLIRIDVARGVGVTRGASVRLPPTISFRYGIARSPLQCRSLRMTTARR
jgi:hypothetical protein